jgi:DNA-binding Xre family transcriptional regulator
MKKKITKRDETNMAVRLRLYELLRDHGLTQAKFSELSGISKTSISGLVNQPSQIRFDTIDKICDTLGVKPEDLFERVKIVPLDDIDD